MSEKQGLEAQVFKAVAKQGMAAVVFRNALGRKLRINIVDSECMSFLSIHGPSTAKDISRYTGLSTGATTVMLDRLEKAGYIVRKPNLNDRRGVIIEVDKKWVKAIEPLVTEVQQMHRELLASYNAQELAIICDFLEQFTDNVQAQAQKIEES